MMNTLIVKLHNAQNIEHLKNLGVPVLVIYQRLIHGKALVKQYEE